MLKKYICIKQHDLKDCGAACLATISKQYGLKIPISKIREIAGTDKQGTSALGVIKAAEKLGFSAKGVKASKPEDLFSCFPLPAIAHVIIDNAFLHYVVIHKISKKEVLIADPGKGLVKYKPEDFFKIWTGVLIFMVPSAEFKKGNETKGLFSRFLGLIKLQKGLMSMWKAYKRIFNVNSYKNTAVIKFMDAKKMIERWKPDRELELMIKGDNSN